MSSLSPSQSQSSASVRNILTLLASRDAQLVAGGGGLERRVTWACRMRSRLPAFESVQGGELALLTLAQLRRLDETLPHLLKSLYQAGVAVVAVAAPSEEALSAEAREFADQMHLPLILLPLNALLEEIEREVITFVVSFRGETERKATEIASQLMQLSLQGAGIQGVCEHLATNRGKWVVIQDADQHVRFQAAPANLSPLILPSPLTDEQLRRQGLVRVVEPIPSSRHEIAGYLSLIGNESDFDYLERIILGQATPIIAIEFARERDRTEVESRYQVEAFTDVIQGHYQQPEEMMARARLLGYDLTTPQTVVVFEISPEEHDFSASGLYAQWSKRVREELLREWSGCWVQNEARRVIAILPLPAFDDQAETEREHENSLYSRLERVVFRISSQKSNGTGHPIYSCGIGRIARGLQGLPLSFREAQQALEIGRRLFGEGNLHSFARLGIYRLLFHLNGHSELDDFYYETLGPLLNNDSTYVETLEGFFRCNGNLSEMARTMHFHRNSLLYRINRIEALLGRSLEDPELRLALQIALKIHHLKKH
ncbi:CdaR family transcriptional regulator [Dictyobacter alpinus]|uniref:CdaR family transcriptional regulator n=1 Tax=Dictyobacter alpinus TaxID=2014873 RepID=A0A402B0B6_9CHLR|nr:helix-turn-helix domain-containing protein [Dictyobacter alpinus]GCE24793.1 CdaR family transcriptional regulator [Dictyobacter alpinus]